MVDNEPDALTPAPPLASTPLLFVGLPPNEYEDLTGSLGEGVDWEEVTVEGLGEGTAAAPVVVVIDAAALGAEQTMSAVARVRKLLLPPLVFMLVEPPFEVTAPWALQAGATEVLFRPLITAYAADRIEQALFDDGGHVLESWQRMGELLPQAVILLSPEGEIRSVNRSTVSLLATPADRLVGNSWRALLSPAADAQALERVFTTRRTRRRAPRALVDARLGQAASLPMEIQATGLWSGTPDARNARFLGTLVIGSDASARLAKETQRRQAEKMEALMRVSGHTAHALEKALTVVIGNVEGAAERAVAATETLMGFAGRGGARRAKFSASDRLMAQQGTLRSLGGSEGQLQLQLETVPDEVAMDPAAFDDIVAALVSNAHEASPPDAQVDIVTDVIDLPADDPRRPIGLPAGQYVRLLVSDPGHGMDEAAVERAFEPYFTTRQEAGHDGLGLSRVYGAVTAAGGHVEIVSRPGEGTTVAIFLLRADDRQPGPRVEAKTLPDGSARVLVIEEDPMVRRWLGRVLGEAGHLPISAPAAEPALEMLERYDVRLDLLITDVVMVGMDGATVAEKLREQYEGLPIIYMSSYVGSAQQRHELLSGHARFLPKPLDGTSFLRTVSEVLGRTNE